MLDQENLGHTPLYEDLIGAINEDREPLVNGQQERRLLKLF